MRAELVQQHGLGDSAIHRLPAAVKLLASLAMILMTVLLPPQLAIWLILPAGLLLVIARLSRLPWQFVARRLLLAEPVVIGVSLMALFGPGGWKLFLLLLAKCSICVTAAVLLSGTTPFSELLRVLRRAGVPQLMVTTLSLMYRYTFVLMDESQRMRRARSSRTFVPPGRKLTWSRLAEVAGQLFVRASERAERIYAAMCARGWR